jgi:HYDIN/CFA65/VesB-like, Ig-like domain
VNFGNQPVGTTSLPKRITLSNKGDVAVNVTGISFTGTDASDFAQTNTCGNSVAAGASCFINVTFTPAATGTATAQVAISDDGGGSPQTAGLVGTGTP